MIKDMFIGVPTWPALILAPLLTCLVLGFHYFNVYQTCTGKSELRNRFLNLAQQASAESDAIFEVKSSTNFSWDTMKVINAFKPDTKHIANCPFGWDWNKNEREQLAAQGNLTMLVFVDNGAITEYLELNNQVIDLGSLQDSYSSIDANFKVSRKTGTTTLLINEYN